MKNVWNFLIVSALAANGAVLAHSDAPGKATPATTSISTEETVFGRAGDPKKVSRTVRVEMGDSMRFTPPSLTVKQEIGRASCRERV